MITLKNAIFDGDNVSFDIFLESLPPDNLWETVRIYGNFNMSVHSDVDSFFTINPELNEYHQSNTIAWGPLDNVTSEFEVLITTAWLEDISLSGMGSNGAFRIEGKPWTVWNYGVPTSDPDYETFYTTATDFTGKLASYSGLASVFGTSDDDGVAGWSIQDLYQPINPSGDQTDYGFGSPIALQDLQEYGDPFYDLDTTTRVTLHGSDTQWVTNEHTTPNYIRSIDPVSISEVQIAPSYSHIGNANNSSSTVQVTDTEYAQSTGSVAFNHSQETISIGNNQYNWTRMQIDERSLYVDNGGTNDYDELTLDADGNPTLAATPEDDQTMGVYVNMRDGLASALVPGENEVTVANAAFVKGYGGPTQNIYTAPRPDYGYVQIYPDMDWETGMSIENAIIHIPLYATPDVDTSQITTEYLSLKFENLPLLANIISNDEISVSMANFTPSLEQYLWNTFFLDNKFVEGDANSFYFQTSATLSLRHKILLLNPELDEAVFYAFDYGTGEPGIQLLTAADGIIPEGHVGDPSTGQYIAQWTLTDFAEPTQEQLDAVVHNPVSLVNDVGEGVFGDGYIGHLSFWDSTADLETSNFREFLNLNSSSDWDSILGQISFDINGSQTYEVGVLSDATLDDVSIENPMDLPWAVELSSSDDIYIGRDDIDNGDGTYTLTSEGIHFSRGNDNIDMGLGYNYAIFGDRQIDTLEINLGYAPYEGGSNATVTMTSGETYSQRYVGVNEVWGGIFGANLIIGSDNDPYNMPSDDFYFLKVSNDGGETYETYKSGEYGDNHLIARGGASYLAGQGGDDKLNAYVSWDYYFNNNADLTTNGSMMYGGEGNDTLSGGVFHDVLVGGQNPEHTYQIDSDDFYNDIGHDFAFIGFDTDSYDYGTYGSAGSLKAVSSIMINGEAIDVDTSAIADDGSMYGEQLYIVFSNAVNAAINAHLGNTEQLWEYLSVSHDENNVADGFVLKYAQGLDKSESAFSYAHSGEQVHHGEVMLPSWAPELKSGSGSTILAANMYAKASEFVQTGDDDDRFVYYRDVHINEYDYGQYSYDVDEENYYDSTNLNAIRGDIIADLDIGQNSLSLRAEEGEGIWFDAGVINHNSVVIDLSYVPEEDVFVDGVTVTIEAHYTADVSITGVNGDISTFTLGELNLPTTALYGDQNYELAYTWETVAIQTGSLGNFIGVSTNTEDVWMDKDVDVLRFEWQAVGEKVGSEGADALTGSNGSNVFAAFGGDDVLNGSGGGDSYQFMGNFGKDKVLEYGDGSEIDILQIGAARENVWFERLGRRGDDLEVTVNDGTHMGTISVGRQFNPYSTLQGVEQIQFGFDGAVSDQTLAINNGSDSYAADIVVMKNGAEYIDVTNSAGDSYIYFNKFETQDGAAVLSLSYADSYYTGFRVDYSNNTSDEILINSSYSGSESGVTHLVSKGFIDIQEGNFGGVEITANATVSNAYDVTRLADANVSGSVDELLFTLQWEDATSYGGV